MQWSKLQLYYKHWSLHCKLSCSCVDDMVLGELALSVPSKTDHPPKYVEMRAMCGWTWTSMSWVECETRVQESGIKNAEKTDYLCEMWKSNYQNRIRSKSSLVEAPSEAVVTHTPNMRSFRRHWLQPQLAVFVCPPWSYWHCTVLLWWMTFLFGKSHMKKLSQYYSTSCKKWVCTSMQLEHAVLGIPYTYSYQVYDKMQTKAAATTLDKMFFMNHKWAWNSDPRENVRHFCPKSLAKQFRDTVKVTKILNIEASS